MIIWLLWTSQAMVSFGYHQIGCCFKSLSYSSNYIAEIFLRPTLGFSGVKYTKIQKLLSARSL